MKRPKILISIVFFAIGWFGEGAYWDYRHPKPNDAQVKPRLSNPVILCRWDVEGGGWAFEPCPTGIQGTMAGTR